MGNTFVSTELAATDAAMAIQDQSLVLNLANRNVQNKFSPGIGQSVKVTVPSEAHTRSLSADGGSTVSTDVTNTAVSVEIEDYLYVRRTITNNDLMDIDNFNALINMPVVSALIAGVDEFLLRKLIYGFKGSQSGSQGSDPSTHANIINAEKTVFKNRRKKAGMASIITPEAYANFRALNIFNDLAYGGDKPAGLSNGVLGQVEDVRFFRTPFGGDVEYGNTAGTILVKGGSQTGTSLTIDGFTNNTGATVSSLQVKKLFQGAQFTIAGVTGTYRLSEDAIVSSNQTTVTLETALDSAPADNAAITFLAADSARQKTNVVYDPNALAAVVLPLQQNDKNVTSVNVGGMGVSIVDEGTSVSNFSRTWAWVVHLGGRVVQPKFGTLY